MIRRIDVRPVGGVDSAGNAVAQQLRGLGVDPGDVVATRIFLIDTESSAQDVERIARELLSDPVADEFAIVTPDSTDPAESRIEVHLKPGVMDPVAASTEGAIRDMGIAVSSVRTGRGFELSRKIDRGTLEQFASRALANGVIESLHFDRYLPSRFQTGHKEPLKLRHVPIRKLSDEELKRLSRDGHLFLSLAEMKAVQSYYREQSREPTDIELETLAQTWSEHCVHKTLKSAVEVVDDGGVVLRKYGNLIKETIFEATRKLMEGARGQGSGASIRTKPPPDPSPLTPHPFCLSVFKDNAGVIAFDDTHGVCFKVETHNHPSALEPYGGAATGVGGCIRDVMGTGLSAKPIANTDVFCVASPDAATATQIPKSTIQNLPKGVIHPRRVLEQVVAGVRDYGNRMGIPTVNGAVYFDDRYLGNPLVFCGCVGLIPRDKVEKRARPGDAIVLMGGRTGRDGIHGATFSSAELTDTHSDEFSHAVQIGNAIEQKRVLDVILQARDRNLFSAITDCGAGGLSSAVGEMGEKLGATVQLDRAPLKYDGLRYDEIWISEAQERMVLAVPPKSVNALLELARSEDVEATVIGSFGTEQRQLVLNFGDTEVGRLSMEFLHNGIPMPTRRALVKTQLATTAPRAAAGKTSVHEALLQLLSHPNIASKHWIIRQYDHEVQGGSVIKPLTGPLQIGPSDAAVIRPKLTGERGVAIGCGLSPQVEDPYQMSLCAIDEAVRNVVAVGADPSKIAILDNFCWPSVDDEETMGTLLRACEACRDASLAYGIPFISGKDSLHNQFTVRETGEILKIPRTLLISAIGVIDDVRKCVTMDLKRAGNHLCRVRPAAGDNPSLEELIATHRALSSAIRSGLIRACHDISDGGPLVCAAEMCIASGLGLDIPDIGFDETRGGYLVEIEPGSLEPAKRVLGDRLELLGAVTRSATLLGISVDDLRKAWQGTLDW